MSLNLDQIQIGIGTWAWGDQLFWGFGQSYQQADLREAYDAILPYDNVMIDTAEVYGMGQSETFIGQFAEMTGQRPLIATKFFPFPWRWRKQSLLNALRDSLNRLRIPQADLYQMHWKLPPIGIQTWMDALAIAAEEGLTRSVGVSNYDVASTRQAHEILETLGLPLASNQVKYSILDRRIEKNGLLALCKDLGIRVIAYSPLEQGLLTGRYSPENPPPGLRGYRYRSQLAAIQPLVQTMRDLGQAYAVDGVVKTPAQIALNWCIQKGTLPIPGAKNAFQATQNLGAAGWQLKSEDVAVLDSLSDEITRHLR